jgi:hypothetical protein
MGDREQLHEAATRIVREKLRSKIKVREPETPHLSTTCRGCGKPLTANRGENRHPSYCSDACYERARRLKHRFKLLSCESCGNDFTATRWDARYCSNGCRQSAWRRRAA